MITHDFRRHCIRAALLVCGAAALLAAVCGAGCASPRAIFGHSASRELEDAKQYFVQGDYQMSLKTALSFVYWHKAHPGYDEALYLAAMNYLYIDIERGNYARSIEYFQKLIDECPGSPLLPKSAKWMNVLFELAWQRERVSRTSSALQERDSRIREHESTLKRADDSLHRTQSILFLKQAEIERLQEEVRSLRKKIEQLERIDVQMYRKKKGLDDGTQ